MIGSLIKNGAVFRIPAYILFFLMLFVPTTYQPIKAVLIAIVLGTIIIEALLTRRIGVDRSVLAITLAMSVVGFLFVSLGMLNRNPGALRVMAVYIFWPILYLMFVAGCARMGVLKGLMRVLVVGAIAVSVYSLLYILHEGKLLPGFLYVELDQGQNIGFYQGHIQYAMYSISSLLFLVPFLLAALVLWPPEVCPPVSRKWLWIAFVLSIVPIVLTERKVLWLLVLGTPFMAMALRWALSPKMRLATHQNARRAMIGMAASAVVLLLFMRFALNFDFTVLLNLVSEAFNFSAGQTDDVIVRKAQYLSLMDEWSQRPLLGYGLGAVASVVRNDDQPWTYELSYVALLFHTGIVGMLVYSAGLIWTYVHGLMVLRMDDRLGVFMGPVLVGTTCFLIGNATNPYLEKYDYLWVLFLPIAIINLWLLKRRALPKEAVVHVAG